MAFIDKTGKSKSRTIRIDIAFNDELEKEAEDQGISSNKLIESIIDNYLNNERWAIKEKKLAIDPITIQSLLEELDEDTVTELGTKLGSVVPREGFMLRGLPLTEESATMFILMVLGESGHWFDVSYHKHSRAYFYVRSSFDGKWVSFIEAYLTAFYMVNFSKKIECHRVGDNLQILL